MEQVRIEVLLEAKQPIAHHQEVLGNSAVCMRRKVRQPDGQFSRVPYVTGDSMRHGLREAGTYALLEAAGLLDAELSEAAIRLLFAGGMVTGGSSGAIKLSDYHELVELCPHLALLGGCAQNRVIPGKMQVDDAMLVCTESAHLLSDWSAAWIKDHGQAISSGRQHIELVQRVRMDPMLDPSKRRMLSASEREKSEQRLLKSENASAHNDAIEKSESKSSMLPRTYETLVPGSLFAWRVSATCHTALDRDMLYVMLSAFMARCQVGGKRATGNGQLWPVAAVNLELPKWSEKTEPLDTTALAGRAGSLFRAHVETRRNKLKSYLAQVDA